MPAIDIAREAAAHKERAWSLYDEITALMPSMERVQSTSSDDLDRFLGWLSTGRNEIPHAYPIYEVLRQRRETGCEPERTHPLELDAEAILRIADLGYAWQTAEREFSSLGYIIMTAVQAEGVEAGEEVMAILPPSSIRYEVGVLVEHMAAMAAATP